MWIARKNCDHVNLDHVKNISLSGNKIIFYQLENSICNWYFDSVVTAYECYKKIKGIDDLILEIYDE